MNDFIFSLTSHALCLAHGRHHALDKRYPAHFISSLYQLVGDPHIHEGEIVLLIRHSLQYRCLSCPHASLHVFSPAERLQVASHSIVVFPDKILYGICPIIGIYMHMVRAEIAEHIIFGVLYGEVCSPGESEPVLVMVVNHARYIERMPVVVHHHDLMTVVIYRFLHIGEHTVEILFVLIWYKAYSHSTSTVPHLGQVITFHTGAINTLHTLMHLFHRICPFTTNLCLHF